MTLPPELVPRTKGRVMDLVEAAGLDVSDWSNYKNGKSNPSANPRYCYEWALGDFKSLVVCNLWTENMLEVGDAIEQHLVLTDSEKRKETNHTRRNRRQKMAKLLLDAAQKKLPVRVIVLDGQRQEDVPDAKPKVRYRALDPEPWAVVDVDEKRFRFILRRGAELIDFVDQFDLLDEPPPGGSASKRVTTIVRERSSEVRRHVLRRANGSCEYCGERGFILPDGRLYLETHHIVPLSENGADTVQNVAALCANHHREAHFGSRSEKISKRLATKLMGI